MRSTVSLGSFDPSVAFETAPTGNVCIEQYLYKTGFLCIEQLGSGCTELFLFDCIQLDLSV